MRFEPVLFFRTCAKKKAAHERRPESREETPKKASATSLLHCNNDLGINFVQQERQIFCLPYFLPICVTPEPHFPLPCLRRPRRLVHLPPAVRGSRPDPAAHASCYSVPRQP